MVYFWRADPGPFWRALKAVMNMAAGNHEAEALEVEPKVECKCGTEVDPEARFFATPCGTFCEECFGVHAENCEICRKELG